MKNNDKYRMVGDCSHCLCKCDLGRDIIRAGIHGYICNMITFNIDEHSPALEFLDGVDYSKPSRAKDCWSCKHCNDYYNCNLNVPINNGLKESNYCQCGYICKHWEKKND